jgi:hypothetical protein
MVMWYCGDRHLLCSQPQLSVHHYCSNNLVYEDVWTIISLAEFHVSLKENTPLRYVVSYFLEKVSIRKIFTIRVMGSVSCNSAAMEKNVARFDVRKAEF